MVSYGRILCRSVALTSYLLSVELIWHIAHAKCPDFLVGVTFYPFTGIYIPTLARAILEDESSPLRPLIHGMAIGDGCVGLDVLCGPVGGPFFDVEFLHGHGQFSDRLYSQIQATCTHSELVDGNTSKACNKVLADISGQVGGYYSYK